MTTTTTTTTSLQQIPKLYTLKEIEKATCQTNFESDLINAIRDGFVALEKDEFYACPIQTMGLPPFPFVDVDGYAAQTCVKSGYFKGKDYYVIKVASGGFPMKNSGLMQVYSQRTGQLEAILLDDGILTEIRTAAVGALAARLSAPKSIQTIGIIGTGIQARFQLNMLPNITNCRKVLVWGRNAEKAEEYAKEMGEKGWEVNVATSTGQLLESCQLIVTTTCSREPLLGLDDEATIQKIRSTTGLHITCIGADAPGKIELDPNLVAKADLLIADTIGQTIERGEFQTAVADGLVEKEAIVSLGDFIHREDMHRKKMEGETNDGRITIFDSSGVALQDCVISQMTYDALRSMT